LGHFCANRRVSQITSQRRKAAKKERQGQDCSRDGTLRLWQLPP